MATVAYRLTPAANEKPSVRPSVVSRSMASRGTAAGRRDRVRQHRREGLSRWGHPPAAQTCNQRTEILQIEIGGPLEKSPRLSPEPPDLVLIGIVLKRAERIGRRFVVLEKVFVEITREGPLQFGEVRCVHGLHRSASG